MEAQPAKNKIELIKICPASFLLRIAEAGISWVFNAWPDTAKYLIQKELEINGIVYPDVLMQTDRGVSCTLVEFPLLHSLFNQGMFFRGEKPHLVGTQRQLDLASESFRRGLYGFYDTAEMEGCDLSDEEMEGLAREIEGLSLNGIQPIDELLELIPLIALEDSHTNNKATTYRGMSITKKSLNVFGIEYQGEQVEIDCNLSKKEQYVPPLDIDVKHVPFKLFQVIDTGEEDGFSPKSCMHTLIQWRERIICIDLPMNVTYLLDKVSISRTEIDAVIFTHNHDDHIGDLSTLIQMDKKVTIICPRIVWKSILLKASAMFDMEMDELAEYFEYIPIRYGEEYDYAGLLITAHPSIHPVPCAVYRIRGIVDREWKVYGHMSDILNFQRCQNLIREGYISQKRFNEYRSFLLEPATVKKIDVGTKEGEEASSVHGSWRDFSNDSSEHIVLAHTREESLDLKATILVGQFARAGSARDLGNRTTYTYQDKYRERSLKYLGNYLFSLLGNKIRQGLIKASQVRAYLRILADNEIVVIQPNTPFLKMGTQSEFVDLVIGGVGSIWRNQGTELIRVTNVNAGDVLGDVGVLSQIPRTATIRSETYMHVLRIPGFLFREIVVNLGIFPAEVQGQNESLIQKIWRHREIVQGSHLFGAEVPVHLQDRVAKHSVEVLVKKGDSLFADKAAKGALFLGSDADAFAIMIDGLELGQDLAHTPVFGEGSFVSGKPEPYDVSVRKGTILLRMGREELDWMRKVPIFKLRLKQLAEQRALLMQRLLLQERGP